MDGIILINKEKEYTSHDVVNKVKKILNSKVGHTGTLDPNATGVLPLLIGNATKISKYLIEHDKEYEVLLKLGIKTDSADGEGNIIEEQKVRKYTEKEIKDVLHECIGKQEQVPPMYSAIKVNGKKLYEYARSGQTVEVKPRNIELYNLLFKSYNEIENEISFVVSCSKGTYIRTVCEQVANKLGTIGYMKELNRTIVGKFFIKDAITIEELEKNKDNEKFMKEQIISIQKYFEYFPKIKLEKDRLKHFLNGVKITYKVEDGVYNIYDENNNYIGLAVVKDNALKRDVIL